MTSVVSTETTSPGLTSCSGCFFNVGTGGGGPRLSSALFGFGVAVGFGCDVVRRWPLRCALATENKSAAETSSATQRNPGTLISNLCNPCLLSLAHGGFHRCEHFVRDSFFAKRV